MSIETAVEQAVKGLLEIAQIEGITTHDQSIQTEEFAGIGVSAKSVGVESVGAGNRNRLERIECTVSIRSVVPDMDADWVSDLWNAIASAILKPQLPAGMTWLTAVPVLSQFAHFTILSEANGVREDQEERRKHTRTFVIAASIVG